MLNIGAKIFLIIDKIFAPVLANFQLCDPIAEINIITVQTITKIIAILKFLCLLSFVISSNFAKGFLKKDEINPEVAFASFFTSTSFIDFFTSLTVVFVSDFTSSATLADFSVDFASS